MDISKMNEKEVRTRFNSLRERYGNLLIKLKKEKISENQWYTYISNEFSEDEISFIFGQNIWRFVDKQDKTIDLGKGTMIEISNNTSRLLVSSEKAGIMTWICTDGYMSLHRGYYISIKDNDILIFNYFKNLIRKVYGDVHFGFAKVSNKNAFQCIFSSKKIFRDLITYIPLSSSKTWTIPIELLDKEAKIEVLKILTHTEGTVYQSFRNRNIEITLANFEVLEQSRSLFEEFGINTNDIRKDFSDGWNRYKLSITRRENLERFRDIINFIPNTEKYNKFERILSNYKEYHKQDSSRVLLNNIQKNKFSMTKYLVDICKLDRSTVSRNLKRLRQIGAIDYKKGQGNTKHWFSLY